MFSLATNASCLFLASWRLPRLVAAFLAMLIGCLSMATWAAPPPGTVAVVEYFNSQLQYYFRTADPIETGLLDSGVGGPHWQRTGDDFLAYPYNDHPASATPVCRFYGSVDPGPNTHFYTADGVECVELSALFASIINPRTPKLNYEKSSFAIERSRSASCDAGGRPVWRLFNNGTARGMMPNHRFTTSASERGRMLAAGWIDEGTAFCEARGLTLSTVMVPVEATYDPLSSSVTTQLTT